MNLTAAASLIPASSLSPLFLSLCLSLQSLNELYITSKTPPITMSAVCSYAELQMFSYPLSFHHSSANLCNSTCVSLAQVLFPLPVFNKCAMSDGACDSSSSSVLTRKIFVNIPLYSPFTIAVRIYATPLVFLWRKFSFLCQFSINVL